MKSVELFYGAAALLVLGAIAYIAARGPAAVGKQVGKGAVDLVAGGVKGIGEGIGIPDTDESECQACIAARDWWCASFKCPAGTFLKAIAARASGSSSAPASWEEQLGATWGAP